LATRDKANLSQKKSRQRWTLGVSQAAASTSKLSLDYKDLAHQWPFRCCI